MKFDTCSFEQNPRAIPKRPRFGTGSNYKRHIIFEGISVDEAGKQHYLDPFVSYKMARLNAIEYMKKFGYTGEQAYAILGTAPVEGHISGIVDIPNACATLWLPTEIFDFDIMPNANGPIKSVTPGFDLVSRKILFDG